MVLFRIIEPSAGKVFIDDVYICDLCLDHLRSVLSIIPQDPVLFIGTLRTNLDPFSMYTDVDIWNVLTKVHLDTLFKSMPMRLETEIEEKGSNLSLGQRQLLCIARALLRRSKILVLDEATASIDYETDGLIQETIRQSFADCTVLTIAHRLHTVIDSDRIMVLDAGRVIEFDTPKNLVNRQDSAFTSLINETDSQTRAFLYSVVKKSE